MKREEEKRTELQLQYTRDRCAWELEKAELKCRIAQLEAREAAGLMRGGVQSAAGPGSSASRCPREQHGETPTLRREREEQQRILADTYSTAMDLRSRLEHSERDWLREKAELLERFDVERREWENQLKDMQKKIEELYCEVRAKRGGAGLDSGRRDVSDAVHRLSIRSTSTGSSLLSDNSRSEPLSSSSQSEPNRQPSLPGLGHNRNISVDGGCGNRDGHYTTCFQKDNLCDFNVSCQFTRSQCSQPKLVDELKSAGTWQQSSVIDHKEDVDTTELDAVFHVAPECGVTQEYVCKGNEESARVCSPESPLWVGLNDVSDKKKSTIDLNAALKEIARVSEELCSYQDEIKKKNGDKRNRSESLCLPQESDILFGHNETRLEVDEAPCDLSQIYDDLRALERENWITFSPGNTWQVKRELSESCMTRNADPDGYRSTQTSHGVHSEMDTAAPPIPPRTSSWNLSAPTNPDTELHIPESPTSTVKKCHSPCALVDRKCSSPSIVRKFEAMLQENEGKVFVDGVVASCSVPANSNCNMACCHNRWSCDASKFTSSKLSTYGTVQKSFSEVNIRSARKNLCSDYSPGVENLKSAEAQAPPAVPVDLLSSPISPNLQSSKRNLMLEQKTAEFNRTLFQAEMGRGVEEEEDSFNETNTNSVGFQPLVTESEILPSKETMFEPHFTDATTSVMGVHPEVTLSLSDSDCAIQNPEVLPRSIRCATKAQEASVLSPAQPQAVLREAPIPSHSPAHQCEVKHKVQTASSPSRKTQHRAATEALFSEPVLPANTQPVDDSSSKKENPHGAKAQPARAAVSLQQLSAENKQRQTVQPRHVSGPPCQSDSSRPGPRIMNDHPWKPLTLAAYPRPEGSRSNYGAVERILKNYESAARVQQMHSNPNQFFSVTQEKNTTELDMLNVNPLPLPLTLRQTQSALSLQTHPSHAQLSSHGASGVKEIQLVVQEDEEPSVFSSSTQKCFSRPARPANRRLPSRWASRSPTSSSSTSSSPSTTPVVPPSIPLQKHTSSFTYSHTFHIETVII